MGKVGGNELSAAVLHSTANTREGNLLEKPYSAS